MKRLLLFLPLLLAGLAACGGPQPGGFTMPPRPVAVTVVVQRDVPVYLDEIGTCVSPEAVSIIPQVTGKIIEARFKEGSNVRKGELLFNIDPRPYQAALGSVEAALLQDQAKLGLAKIQLDRSQALVEGNFISKQDMDALKTGVVAAEAQATADRAAIATAQLNLEYCSIVAPIDGRLGKCLVDPGNVVAANQSAPLVTLARIDRLYVDFAVAETDFPDVRNAVGVAPAVPLPMVVGLPDHPDIVRNGELSFVDNAVQIGSGTVQLRGGLDNRDGAFWPGQFVTVRLILKTIPGALLVPSRAVQISQQGPFVFVLKEDQTVELRPVKAGQRQGALSVIDAGLKPGERIVVTGQLALAPGAKVAPTEYTETQGGAPPKEL